MGTDWKHIQRLDNWTCSGESAYSVGEDSDGDFGICNSNEYSFVFHQSAAKDLRDWLDAYIFRCGREVSHVLQIPAWDKMETIKLNDTTAVTTPIYIGASSDVELAAECDHQWLEHNAVFEEHPFPECTIILEKCSMCIATRMKIVADNADDLNEFIDG